MVLLAHRHLIELRDLIVERLEPLDWLAVCLRPVVEMLVEPEVGVEAGLLPFEAQQRERQHPRLELLERLEGQPEAGDFLRDERHRGRRDDLVERLAGREHAPREHRHLRVGREHFAHVHFLDEEIGVLERRLERRDERVVVLREQMNGAHEVHRALAVRRSPDEAVRLGRRLDEPAGRARGRARGQWSNLETPCRFGALGSARTLAHERFDLVDRARHGRREPPEPGVVEEKRVFDADADVQVLGRPPAGRAG